MTNLEEYFIYNSVIHVVNNIKGDIVECGVWKGGSIMTIALTLIKKKNQIKNFSIRYILWNEPSYENDYLFSDKTKLAKELQKK